MLRILYTLMTSDLVILTVLLSCTLFTVQGPLYMSWPNLVDCWFLTKTCSLSLYLCWVHLLFYFTLFLFIASCFCILFRCQSAWNTMFMMTSCPNTNWLHWRCLCSRVDLWLHSKNDLWEDSTPGVIQV